MKQNLKNILLIINTILLVVCLVQLADLRTQFQNMQSNTGNQISNILTNLNSSYSYIEETLEEQASIISKSEFEFGEIDIKAGTVEVNAYVIPKEYQPDVTQAFFLCGDEEIPAEYIGGKYVATMHMPLYEDVMLASVMFKENGTIRTEELDWFFNPRAELLPYVYAYNLGSFSFGKSEEKENVGTWTFSGDIEIDVAAKDREEFELETAEIVRCLDGKEVERRDITLDAMIAHNRFLYNWNPTYEIPYGSTQEIFVDITMKGGLVYRSWISYCRMDEQGTPIDDEGYRENLEADIYDRDGNLLYTVNEELHR